MTTTHVTRWTDEASLNASEIAERLDELDGTPDHDEQAEFRDLSIVRMNLVTFYGADRWTKIVLVRSDRFSEWVADKSAEFSGDIAGEYQIPTSYHHALDAFVEDLDNTYSRTVEIMGVAYIGPRA